MVVSNHNGDRGRDCSVDNEWNTISQSNHRVTNRDCNSMGRYLSHDFFFVAVNASFLPFFVNVVGADGSMMEEYRYLRIWTSIGRDGRSTYHHQHYHHEYVDCGYDYYGILTLLSKKGQQ